MSLEQVVISVCFKSTSITPGLPPCHTHPCDHEVTGHGSPQSTHSTHNIHTHITVPQMMQYHSQFTWPSHTGKTKFNTALNTITPQSLIEKLPALGLSTPMCYWILDSHSNRAQVAKINISQQTSQPITPVHHRAVH